MLVVPTTPWQEDIYSASIFAPPGTYHCSFALRWEPGRLSPEQVRQGFAELIRRQPAMRCQFRPRARQLWCEVLDDVPWTFTTVTLETDDPAAVVALSTTLASTQLSPARAPLWRGVLVRTDRWEYLILALHHLIFDGVSEDILYRTLCAMWTGGEAPDVGAAELVRSHERARDLNAEALLQLGQEDPPATTARPDATEPSTNGEVTYLKVRGSAPLPFWRWVTSIQRALAEESMPEPVLFAASTRAPDDADIMGCYVNTVPLPARSWQLDSPADTVRTQLATRHLRLAQNPTVGGSRPDPAAGFMVNYRPQVVGRNGSIHPCDFIGTVPSKALASFHLLHRRKIPAGVRVEYRDDPIGIKARALVRRVLAPHADGSEFSPLPLWATAATAASTATATEE